MEQNQFNPNENNMASGVPPSTLIDQAPKKESKIGPLAGIVIVVIVLIVGALYFWGERLNEEGPSETDPIVDNLENQSRSDELGAIENDLNATVLEGIDVGF